MSLWNLDPRQAGVTEPEVAIVERSQTSKSLGYAPFVAVARDHNYEGDTEAAALRAARVAAGFGHVAEQPCAQMQYTFSDGDLDCIETPDDECEQCGWPRDRHGKGEVR